MTVHGFLNSAYVHLVYMCAFLAIGFVLERKAPVATLNMRDRCLNVSCGVVFGVVDILCGFYVSYLVAPLIRHPLIRLSVTDHHWVAFAVVLSLSWSLMRDFFYYWFHRCQHASKWLWAEHALHHSDTALNVTTAVRHHWLEMPLNLIFVVTPLMILFKPPLITVPATYMLSYFVGYFIHCNVRLGAGWLSKVFVSPRNHRIHHSREDRHLDKNFAQFFSLWDVVFGTYYEAQPDEFPETGLASGELVTTLSHAAFMPFMTWYEMLRTPLRRLRISFKSSS
jgi:sterol desaturase/sphingolipid hydroxylase (fatty acid hydroxylase superfamily)